jgi:hypothetical protein
MNKITELASGQIHMSDEIHIWLIAPDGWPKERIDPEAVAEQPARVRIVWPDHVTACTPARFAGAMWRRRACTPERRQRIQLLDAGEKPVRTPNDADRLLDLADSVRQLVRSGDRGSPLSG